MESAYTARYRGFESLPLRSKGKSHVWCDFFFGGLGRRDSKFILAELASEGSKSLPYIKMKTPSRALKQSQQALTERRIPMPKILAELASEGSKSLLILI